MKQPTQRPQGLTTEKKFAYGWASAVFLVVLFLIVRDKPYANPQTYVLVRIVLSFAVAVFGATIPGFLRVQVNVPGLLIRAAGALALFILTYFYAPKLLPSAGDPFQRHAVSLREDNPYGFVTMYTDASIRLQHGPLTGDSPNVLLDWNRARLMHIEDQSVEMCMPAIYDAAHHVSLRGFALTMPRTAGCTYVIYDINGFRVVAEVLENREDSVFTVLGFRPSDSRAGFPVPHQCEGLRAGLELTRC